MTKETVSIDGLAARLAKYKPYIVSPIRLFAGFNRSVTRIANRQSFNRHCGL